LDVSLAKTGVALIESWTDHAWKLTTYRVPTPPHLKGDTRALRDRMAHVRSECSIAAERATLVVMEGPAFAATGSVAKDLAGLWWLVYDRLCQDHRVVVVPPSTLKKWATGKGNAGKPQVGIGVAKAMPEDVWLTDFATLDDNEIDAAALAAMGVQLLGCDDAPIPSTALRRLLLAGLSLPAEEAA
jgi:Holliday junction resolvasome RuvABC endonuclease subunit